jgi:hypothetical protein
VKNLAFSYATLHVITSTLFNESPRSFISGSHSKGNYDLLQYAASSGISKISLRELFNFDAHDGGSTRTLTDQIWANVKANAMTATFSLAGIAVAKKVLPKLGVTRMFNQASRALNLQKVVKA